ncbi:hypothetical protein DXA95_04685 [Odoribacter sp. OF09-27XD]|jgi:hypothetical protein|nr:hypothetical protein [Odoribacter sp. OF09-27XD]RHV96972.1 hypothetical protein DXA95_04685 [Odoribacter sp. OF09-27XD]
MSFTQQVFIRKNTPELREKLKVLGHQLCSCCNYHDGWLFTSTSCDVHRVDEEEESEFLADTEERTGEIIDCGTNEDLFLAIAALRDDSDNMQWFTDGNGYWQQCIGNFRYPLLAKQKIYKASVPELIEHFKDTL